MKDKLLIVSLFACMGSFSSTTSAAQISCADVDFSNCSDAQEIVISRSGTASPDCAIFAAAVKAKWRGNSRFTIVFRGNSPLKGRPDVAKPYRLRARVKAAGRGYGLERDIKPHSKQGCYAYDVETDQVAVDPILIVNR